MGSTGSERWTFASPHLRVGGVPNALTTSRRNFPLNIYRNQDAGVPAASAEARPSRSLDAQEERRASSCEPKDEPRSESAVVVCLVSVPV
jgi:hypothetical protein